MKTLADLWLKIPSCDIQEIIAAKNQLHQAVQYAAAVGRSFLPEHKEDEQANLEWLSYEMVLAGRSIGADSFRVALDIENFQLLIMDSMNIAEYSFLLKGKKENDVITWLKSILGKYGLDDNQLTLDLPYDIPEYRLGTTEAFNAEPRAGFRTLSTLYANAELILSVINQYLKAHQAIRCWPHHFDLAISIPQKTNAGAKESERMGVGLSPGDDLVEEPYFYVNYWPAPDHLQSNLNRLKHRGEWNTKTWFGTILRYSHIMNTQHQAELVSEYFSESIQTIQRLAQKK